MWQDIPELVSRLVDNLFDLRRLGLSACLMTVLLIALVILLNLIIL